MSEVATEPRRVSVSDDELCAWFAGSLPSRFPPGATIVGIHRTPCPTAASFPAEVVRVRLGDGREVGLFLKDLSTSRLPKDDLSGRRTREFLVYRDLLGQAGAGTAHYYGAIANAALDRLCLVLEFVDGVELRSLGFDHWVSAARWLGRFQGEFAAQGGGADLEGCGFLVRHNADFFRSKAELAQAAVSEVSAALAPRLARALRHYDRVVDLLAHQPRTLVHGSYRSENILINAGGEPPRVCPVDWELAASGAPLYDLAFLSDGFRPPKLDSLRDAYRAEAARYQLAVPGREEMCRVVDGVRLHKTLKALSECVAWSFPERTVVKLVGMAENLGDACGASA